MSNKLADAWWDSVAKVVKLAEKKKKKPKFD